MKIRCQQYINFVSSRSQRKTRPGSYQTQVHFRLRSMSTEKNHEGPNAKVEELRQQYRDLSDQRGASGDSTWESLWQKQTTPWDLETPTPALLSELENHWKSSTKPVLRTLVPGCGAGYDLVSLARHHDDLVASGRVKKASVVGLDLSETCLSRAAEVLESACEFDPMDRPTRVDLVRGDFFDTSSWKTMYSFGGDESGCWKGGKTCKATFDFIFDYTFFCAIPPELRNSWGEQISHLLTPESGRLLTLMFPIAGDGAEMTGPPFPVSIEDYKKVLLARDVVMEATPHENLDTVKPRIGRELACWWSRLEEAKAKL